MRIHLLHNYNYTLGFYDSVGKKRSTILTFFNKNKSYTLENIIVFMDCQYSDSTITKQPGLKKL